MQFLSISRRLTDKFPAEVFTPALLAAETARVRELYASGILRQLWKRGDTPGASILWEAASKADVEAAIASGAAAEAVANRARSAAGQAVTPLCLRRWMRTLWRSSRAWSRPCSAAPT